MSLNSLLNICHWGATFLPDFVIPWLASRRCEECHQLRKILKRKLILISFDTLEIVLFSWDGDPASSPTLRRGSLLRM